MLATIVRSTPIALGAAVLVHVFNVLANPPFEVYYSVLLSAVALTVLIALERESRSGRF